MTPDGFLTKMAACRYLTCDPKTLSRAVRDGELTEYRGLDKRKRFFKKKDLDRLTILTSIPVKKEKNHAKVGSF